MLVLGIETSCDETAVGLYGGEPPKLVDHVLSSQIELHAQYGGVVPELAARDHQHHLLPLVDQLMQRAGVAGDDLAAIACTAGPGLIGALKTGLSLAAGLALGWRIPMLRIHHMEAHLLSVLLEDELPFPWVVLLVSGGHTQLVEARGLGQYRLLGQSRDDAAGEAFDKVAKLLNLPYPGGPSIERLAASGDAGRFDFPRPMVERGNHDFSFSGLKTAVLYRLRDELGSRARWGAEWTPESQQEKTLQADIAASFQRAVADTVARKAVNALAETGIEQLVVAGGVGANAEIRQALADAAAQLDARVCFPSPGLYTDNGAMVALAGWLRLRAGERGSLDLNPINRWPLEQLQPPAQTSA